MKKWKCTECGTVSQEDKLLNAVNPFDSESIIIGCPVCKSINSFALVCDEYGCKDEVTCGFPTPDGYRETCGKHAQKIKKVTT